MKKNWKNRMEQMIAGLRSNENIEVQESSINEPATQKQLEVLNNYGKTFASELQSFYAEMNGMTLTWKTRAGKTIPEISGSVKLLPIEKIFSDKAALKPFDFFVPEACAAFILPPGATGSPVYFQYFGEKAVNTHYSFTEYLGRLLISRGYWYWIQSLSSETMDNPEAVQFLQMASVLFPDFNSRLFIPKN